jgi:hypothetical protein
MPDRPSNPPAFPRPIASVSEEQVIRDGITSEAQEGMELRDYFAAHALTGLLAFSPCECRQSPPETAAKEAYEMADAMLAARERK